MYYIIYKTTNILNNKIYIGQHITDNIDDRYMGSGSDLLRDMKKYGKNNFNKEILHVFDNFSDMDNKEIEIVNEVFIKRKDTYNIILGGQGFDRSGTIIVKIIKTGDYRCINICDFDRKIHKTASTGKLVVCDETSKSGYRLIDAVDYNNEIHKTPSSGYTTVYDKKLKENKRILLHEYDPDIHERVCGGIVAKNKNSGELKYIKKDEFYTNREKYVHYSQGNVTVTVIDTNETKHISSDEFYTNRHLYKHITEGYVTGRCKETNKKRRFNVFEITDNIKSKYIFSTYGQITVYDINIKKFINIDKNIRNKEIHKLSSDKKFKWYNDDNELICEYWGCKKDFKIIYNVPERLWLDLINGKKFTSRHKKYQRYCNSYFIVDEWK